MEVNSHGYFMVSNYETVFWAENEWSRRNNVVK